MIISSMHNPRVQEARRLMLAKYRQRTGRVLVEGLKHIRDAQDAGGRLVALFVSGRVVRDPVATGLMDVAASNGADVLVCSDEVVSSLSSGTGESRSRCRVPGSLNRTRRSSRHDGQWGYGDRFGQTAGPW